jgi:hypothetical protein
MGVSVNENIDALVTTTLKYYRNKLQDNIFDNYPFLSYINGKLAVALRGENGKVKRLLGGGYKIVEQVMYEGNSTANSYAGAEVIDTTLQDGMTQAIYDWKQYATTVGITGKERKNNRGEQQLINLVEAKVKQAEMSMRKKLSEGAWGDGTGNGGKDLVGLQAIVSDTSTLGGIDPSTFAWWKSTVNATVGSFASNGINKMKNTYNTVSFGNEKPDIVFTTQDIFEYYEGSLQPQMRYTSNKAADAGFENLLFKSAPVIFDRDCPSGSMYFLNSNHLSFDVDDQTDMDMGPFVTPDNQDVGTAKILFMGNLTTGNRRMHGVMTGITE